MVSARPSIITVQKLLRSSSTNCIYRITIYIVIENCICAINCFIEDYTKSSRLLVAYYISLFSFFKSIFNNYCIFWTNIFWIGNFLS